MPKIIETDRLILRTWTDDDLKPFADINHSEAVMEFFPNTLSYTESENFYKRIIDEFACCGFGLYAVELKNTGEFIGYTGFHRFNFDAYFSPGIEVGWRLDSRYWNQGYATEAAKACLEHAASKNLFSRVYSFTATCNHRSERVMQKIGMVYEGLFQHPALPSGHRLKEHVLYSLALSPESKEVRASGCVDYCQQQERES